MNTIVASPRSPIANGLYGVLNPIPYGCFAAALVFDIFYARTAVIFWTKGAAWLITFGLFIAVIPRFINLAQVWITGRGRSTRAEKLDFWCNLLAVVAAIFNAFVHSRDAYAVVPAGAWLSVATVFLLAVGRLFMAMQATRRGELP